MQGYSFSNFTGADGGEHELGCEVRISVQQVTTLVQACQAAGVIPTVLALHHHEYAEHYQAVRFEEALYQRFGGETVATVLQ